MTVQNVALVTGAARGIGRAIALRLAKDGFNVAVNDMAEHQDQIASLKNEIQALGKVSIECIADVSKEAEVKNMIDQTVEKLGGLDVMVANAGISMTKTLLESTLEDWDRIFNVNGKGVFLCYKYAAQVMIQQGRGGRIIGASSLAGKQGYATLSLYSSTKFTVRALTQSAAQELKPHGITVNAYAPGVIRTAMTQDLINHKVTSGEAFSPGEIGEPDEVAGLVSYLTSKEARFITGQTVNINGGYFCD